MYIINRFICFIQCNKWLKNRKTLIPSEDTQHCIKKKILLFYLKLNKTHSFNSIFSASVSLSHLLVLMATCSLLPKSFLLLLYRNLIFAFFYTIFFLCHLKRKLEVCKSCRILLYIKIGWEGVSIANPQAYRCSIYLIVFKNRIICYWNRISN